MPSWVKPKTWLAGEGVTPSKLNRYLSEQTDYLRYRLRTQATITTDIALSNASMAAIDDTQLKLAHSLTEGADLMLTVRLS